MPLRGYSFTWSHRSGDKMSKLNQFLLSEALLEVFPHINGVVLDGFLSNHSPIFLREMVLDYGTTPF